jgi:hypothetical protein
MKFSFRVLEKSRPVDQGKERLNSKEELFMKNGIAKEVWTEFEGLSDEDKNSLLTVLKAHFGKQLTFSLDELSRMELKDLETIKSVIGGIILTREHAKDFPMIVEKLKDKDLPSSVSFGNLNKDNMDYVNRCKSPALAKGRQYRGGSVSTSVK